MKYHYRVSPHRRRKYLKSVYIFFVIIAVIAGLIILAVRLDNFLQNRVNQTETTTSEQTSAYFASSNKVFRTDYFQFQAGKKWAEIPSESTKDKYVYRGINKTIIENELIIYVNNIPENLSATRLLPVRLPAGGQSLLPDSISGHCNEASKDHNIDEKVVTYKKVMLNCDIDNTQFNVLVGLVGDTTRMTLNRPDGSTADYTVFYRNVKAVPDASELLQVIQSFQTR